MPFGYRTTALEVVEGQDLSGRTAIVTGGNSGLGTETVRALLSAGARVVFSSRNLEAGQVTADELKESQLKGEVRVLQLDLADLASVSKFASEVHKEERIDYMILNAGVMACPYGLTKDGFEMQIGTNVFGHYLLTKLLLDKMTAQKHPSRIVALSSSGHRFGGLDVSDLHYKHGRSYGRWSAYGQSKLADILLAKELSRRLANTSVKAFSLHPGPINTNLQRHNWWLNIPAYLFGYFLKSAQAGAATTVFAATAPELDDHPGAYLEDCHIAQPKKTAEDAELAKAFYDTMEAQIQEALGKS